MEDEPTNAATEMLRRFQATMNDEEYVRRAGMSLLSPDYMRYDRRRPTPLPDADAERWLETVYALADVAGAWPSYGTPRFLAVRGDRLATFHIVLGLGDVAEIEFVIDAQVDADLKRLQIAVFFDPEDVDLAIAELDRLHDELTHG